MKKDLLNTLRPSSLYCPMSCFDDVLACARRVHKTCASFCDLSIVCGWHAGGCCASRTPGITTRVRL
eukprot:1551436-Amphidinium_carterae.8